MEFKCLGTGSSGNCYIVKSNRGSLLMLDAGVDIKKIIKEVNLNNLDLCYISHIHKDHSKSQKNLVERGVKILEPITQEITKTLVEAKCGAKLSLLTIPVQHGDCINSALIIQDGEETILYVTDFSLCKYDLSNFKFTSVVVECNYIKDNVVNVSKDNLSRVLENIGRHQSLEGCDLFLSKLDLSKCKEIILIHFSDNYSDPIYMGSYINNKYKIKTLCCRKYGGYDTYE